MDIDATARTMLLHIRAHVDTGGDGRIYGDRTRALDDLDALLANPSTSRLKQLLLPTANLQELSIEYGWGDEFNRLAAELENLLGIA